MNSVGNGLPNNQQKYPNKQSETIETKEMSKKYNFTNLNDQRIYQIIQMIMKKPNQQKPINMEYMQAINHTTSPNSTQQRIPVETTLKVTTQKPQNSNNPNFEHKHQPINANVPIHDTYISIQNNPHLNCNLPQYASLRQSQQQYPYQHQQYPYQYQPRNIYVVNQNPYCYNQPSFFGSFFDSPQPQFYGNSSQVYISGISHGQLRPVQVNNNSPQMMMGNGSRININSMQSESNFSGNSVNRPTLGPQKNTADDKPVVPKMLVTCKFCMCPQSIPGESTLYICCSCQKQNQCFPTHNIFKCTRCNKWGCYQFGTSRLIKCGHCKTDNQVPVSHEESLNISIVNASRIKAQPIIKLQQEKKPEASKPTKNKEVEAEQVLKSEQIRYPGINDQGSMIQILEVINEEARKAEKSKTGSRNI